MMSEIDAQIGRLLESLRASGEDERTLVVFTSDHGEHLGDHWQFSKLSYFDQTFHVPLIIRDPRPAATLGRGRQVSAFTENIDVMPTILEAIGLEAPHQCDGESLTPFLAGGTPAGWRREAHFAFDFRDALDILGSEALRLAPDQCTCMHYAESATSTCTSPPCPRSSSTSRTIRRSLSTAPEIHATGSACSNTPRRC